MNTQKLSLSDIPLEHNANDFGTEGYVLGIEKFITYADTPITIALQGEWGSGKTTLMNRLHNDLCGEGKEFIGININTWEYSMLATPEETVIRIISQLVFSLTENDAKANSKVGQYMRGVFNFAYRFGREFAKGIAPGAGLVIEGMGVPSELPGSKDDKEAPMSLSELRNTLTEAIEKSLSESDKKGILIFVDDLDRLNPPLAVQILELLKNVFTLNNCIFILAIDYDVVVKGLEPKFGKISDANEREFRSFFDKIIQVPFSLPVSSYKPMGFILESLESIGYITKTEKSQDYLMENIERIVVSSVGKNPRSIKRLINTLSLLDCTEKCTQKDAVAHTLDIKIINFAIVALQVCYPKVYNILLKNPIFEDWDEALAAKFNIEIDFEDIKEVNGNIILDELCKKDAYMKSHQQDIQNLLNVIYDNVNDKKQAAKIIKGILDRSSITNVASSSELEAEEFDNKSLIYKLHDNVWEYISKKLPELRKPQFKRNTGNGGYYMFYYSDNNKYWEVIFQPCQTERNKGNKTEKIIALKVFLEVWNERPQRLVDAPYEEVINDAAVRNVIAPLNETVKRLSKQYFIEGRTFNGMMFDNLFDEFKYRKDELWNAISGNVEYWVNQKSASAFEDPTIVAVIGDLIVSAHEMNVRALSLE